MGKNRELKSVGQTICSQVLNPVDKCEFSKLVKEHGKKYLLSTLLPLVICFLPENEGATLKNNLLTNKIKASSR